MNQEDKDRRPQDVAAHDDSAETVPDGRTLTGDRLVRAVGLHGQVRAVAVQSTEAVRALTSHQDLGPMAAAALGRLAMGAQLLSVDLEPDTTLTAMIHGDGPLGTLTTIADASGYVKGLVTNPHVPSFEKYPGKLDVGRAVGAGTLTVIRERRGTSPQTGVVNLVSGEIAEDLTYYLAASEQVPSIVALGVGMRGRIQGAAGLMVQLLPGATEDTIRYLEARAAGFPEISYLLEQGFHAGQLIDLFLGDPDVRYLEAYPIGFRCDCSRERMAAALMALTDSDRKELASDPEGIKITCDFCKKEYAFTRDELEAMRASGSS